MSTPATSPRTSIADLTTYQIDNRENSATNCAKVKRVVLGVFAAISLLASAFVGYGAFTSVSVFTGALAAGAFTAAATWLTLPVTAAAFLALGIGLIVIAAKVKDYTDPKELEAYRAEARVKDFKQLMDRFGPEALVKYIFNPDYLPPVQSDLSPALLEKRDLASKLAVFLDNNPQYCDFKGRINFEKEFNIEPFIKTDKNDGIMTFEDYSINYAFAGKSKDESLQVIQNLRTSFEQSSADAI